MYTATYAFQPATAPIGRIGPGPLGQLETCETLLDDPRLLADQLAVGAPDGHYVKVWMRDIVTTDALGRPDAVAYTSYPAAQRPRRQPPFSARVLRGLASAA
ncbi:hypothetical protein JNW90_00740 [Micromonospora sp. STR1s_5]|nr:hypothetical protein [Micromonospora sp. STR1s_5]